MELGFQVRESQSIRKKKLQIGIHIVLTMVLKTGPDRPVRPIQPGTGIKSGPVIIKNRK